MLTPEIIAERAAKAHVTVKAVLDRAGVHASTIWRWGLDAEPRRLTVQKVEDALRYFEKQRRS